MKIAVVGAGAIGGLLAHRLARTGVQVSLYARGATRQAIERDGLRLVQPDGTELAPLRLAVSDDAAQLGTQDYVVIAVKGHALPGLAARLAPLIGADTHVVSAINGLPWWFLEGIDSAVAGERIEAVDPDGVVSAALPRERAIGCVVHMAASTLAPGVVRHNSGNRLELGAARPVSQDAAARLTALLASAGFDAVAVASIHRAIWAKLWGNMNMNPLSALSGSTTDRLLDDPRTQALVRRMMEEAVAVGERLGVPVGMSIDDRIAVTRQLGPIKTSMLQDAEAGRPMEIAPILGVFPELGARLGVPTPFCEAVLGLLAQRDANLQHAFQGRPE
ncbi:2-dehydropantoate 2-reductase [Chitinasiproducens palmae]|nr:2-dehydropantoate 2-reductase [Chitinasiproducens palmae]